MGNHLSLHTAFQRDFSELQSWGFFPLCCGIRPLLPSPHLSLSLAARSGRALLHGEAARHVRSVCSCRCRDTGRGSPVPLPSYELLRTPCEGLQMCRLNGSLLMRGLMATSSIFWEFLSQSFRQTKPEDKVIWYWWWVTEQLRTEQFLQCFDLLALIKHWSGILALIDVLKQIVRRRIQQWCSLRSFPQKSPILIESITSGKRAGGETGFSFLKIFLNFGDFFLFCINTNSRPPKNFCRKKRFKEPIQE